MIKSKIKKVMTIIAATAIVSAMTSMTAFADYPTAVYDDPYYIKGLTVSNITDTNWTTTHGYMRHKLNSTSIYVKNNSSVYGAKISVFGRTENGSNQEVSNSPSGSTHYNTHDLSMPTNDTRLIRQFVYERNYDLAVIYFEKEDGDTGFAAGKWSPDSVGSFDGLNY